MVINQEFNIQSDRRVTFEDVTDRAVAIISESGVKDGLMVVFSQHTTCSVLVQEQSDDVNYYGEQLILQDMVNGLSGMFPTCETEGKYLHPGPLHIKIAGEERDEDVCAGDFFAAA